MNAVNQLTATIESFCSYILSLPSEELAERNWGPKEVLAHLVYHHEHYVHQIEAMKSDLNYELPAGRFKDLNAEAIRLSEEVSASDLVERLRAANQRLCSLYLTANPDTVVIQVKLGSKAWKLSDLVPRVEAHVRNHQQELKKESDSKKNQLQAR